MKETPIIFSTPMVRAILEGRKTMTRRVIKPQPDHGHKYVHGYILDSTNKQRKRGDVHFGDNKNFLEGNHCYRRCPYGQEGDLLWVRETWVESFTACLTDPKQSYRSVTYRADGQEYYNFSNEKIKWKPSIFMPKKYARIWLEIVNIRVERLKSLSPEDGIAEGVEHWSIFPSLWDSINGKKHPWSSNPWVFVIEFKPRPGTTA